MLGLGLAYIVGHLLHALSEGAFPSEFKDKAGRSRHPSDLLLDKEGEKVVPARYRIGDLKYHVAAQIEHQFGNRINVEAPWSPNLVAQRRNAFFKCRRLLIEKKAAAYAEQQQGMYALMRGSGAAFILTGLLHFRVRPGAP